METANNRNGGAELSDKVLRDHVVGEQQNQNGRLFQAAESGKIHFLL
jgi:hypothetical protein